MSAVLSPTAPATAGRATGLKVTQARVIRSEWLKFRSLRSTLYTLLAALVLTIGIGALISAVTASQYSTYTAAEKATFDPVGTSLAGFSFAVVAFGVLGVLLISGEYSTGMIRSSLTAVPRRLPVLWAKLTVFAAVIFSVSLVTSLVSFFLGQALLDGQHIGVTITAPGALRSIIGAALFVTVAGMVGIALGTLLRNTAAGISIFTAVFFVIPPLMNLLPASIRDHSAQYLPSSAGEALWGGAYGVAHPLSPWIGFGVLCGYTVILIAAAAGRLRRSDA
jgi:ABC-2 type transport system permease protein